ncbi:MAG: NADP-dependent malic enzyme [Pseudomonadota bacterium]
MSDSKLRAKALDYHEHPTPGKLEVNPSKALTTQGDLALAYSPGVAAACEAIAEDPATASRYTIRGNLVGVVTNGSAVLGLGNIGPLASKPVMEGKAVLFKKFAGIDVFDIEIDEDDPDRLVEVIAALEPTFGGINLEDIKAPECFEVERKLRERMNIPVFHDDQHGTAIIAAAAVLNALQIVDKPIGEVALVTSGAGAAGMACINLLVKLGLDAAKVTLTDREGVVYAGRPGLAADDPKSAYAQTTDARTLGDVMAGADVFLGVSVGGILTPEMVQAMAQRPIILALANPEPEIKPELARKARKDAIIATGRSDYPNQVNNVLCFPFLFRGALDVGATTVNEAMKLAAVRALAALARMEASDVTTAAYGGKSLKFGPDYLIPKPFDPRLGAHIAPAVAQAAMDSGVATRPLEDLEAYRERLTQMVFRSGLVMKPMFDAARADPRRVIFAEGEQPVILSAVQNIIDDGLAVPTLIGRPTVVKRRIQQLGLRIVPGVDFDLINPESDPRFRDYWQLYHQLMARRGVSPDAAKAIVRTRTAVIAALAVKRGEADALICGVVGTYHKKLRYIYDVLGVADGVSVPATLSAMSNDEHTLFITDTYVNDDPSAEELVDITFMAAQRVRDFGIVPRVALVSHSNFGNHADASATKMREAYRLIKARKPDFEVDGEMHADAALVPSIRDRVFPGSELTGAANLLVMPNQDAANIALQLGRIVGDAVTISPMLMGLAHPAHVLTPSATVRRVVNMTAVAVVDAQKAQRGQPPLI